jgi:hypothetical protein
MFPKGTRWVNCYECDVCEEKYISSPQIDYKSGLITVKKRWGDLWIERLGSYDFTERDGMTFCSIKCFREYINKRLDHFEHRLKLREEHAERK